MPEIQSYRSPWEALTLAAAVETLPTFANGQALARLETSDTVRLHGILQIKEEEEVLAGKELAALPAGLLPGRVRYFPAMVKLVTAKVSTLKASVIAVSNAFGLYCPPETLSAKNPHEVAEVYLDGITYAIT